MYKVHPLSNVQTIHIGEGTTIWQFAVILPDARIGSNCNINCHTFVENGVSIGDNVTVKSGIYLWDGITVEDDVFLGPNVVFTNDLRPRSKQRRKPVQTLIRKGASIGANCSILAGIEIGKYAMVGMGSVITKDVPDYALIYGNPAVVKGWVDEQGNKLILENENKWVSPGGTTFFINKDGKLVKQK